MIKDTIRLILAVLAFPVLVPCTAIIAILFLIIFHIPLFVMEGDVSELKEPLDILLTPFTMIKSIWNDICYHIKYDK